MVKFLIEEEGQVSRHHLRQKCHHGNKGQPHLLEDNGEVVKVDYISLVVDKEAVVEEVDINKVEEIEVDIISKVRI